MSAGGIVTNTNQSASFIRMPSLDAFIGIEGAYYNPAGLTHLENGFYLSLSNQFVTQNRTIESTYPNMNISKFEGSVKAPLFPTFYAVYKQDKVAYSLAVNPIGGGGSANFDKGLPSFEQQVAILPGMLTLNGIQTTKYSSNSSFEGRSLNWGFQFNATYAINEMVSLSLGFRYITAKNSYQGYLKDIMINPNQPAFGANYNGNNMVSAPEFFKAASDTLAKWAYGANAYANGLQQAIDLGLGGQSLEFLLNMGQITPEQYAQMNGLIYAAGFDYNGIDIQTAQAILAGAVPVFTAKSVSMAGYSALTADKELDATQEGFGISPIIGINLKLSDELNIALKYEHKAEITMINATKIDDVGLYPNGGKTPNDMPSLFAIGVGYKPMEKLNVTAGVHMYFDKSANYGKKLNGEFVENKDVIDKNFLEIGLGVEYLVTDDILVSAGYLRTQTGVNDKYHSDLSHSLNTNSIGLGGKYKVNDNMALNFGFMTTMYQGYEKEFVGVTPFPTFKETYNRKAMVIALGLDYKF